MGNNIGIMQDDTEKVKPYRLAANLRDMNAQSDLGFMHLKGGNDAEAMKWFRLAADQGDVNAQSNLGFMYSEGRGVAQDDVEAVKWFRLAADQGDVNAQSNLGFMYSEGRGVMQDDAEAVKWYRLAADQQFAQAQYTLGFMYSEGRRVAQDNVEAVKWYRLAADQQFAQAQFALGIMYEKGRGVVQDDVEAVKWYRLAAGQRFAKAQYALGVMYSEGRGVMQDDAEAVKWYRLAADQGDVNAQSNLGFMYQNGRGIAQDDAAAAKWYRLAADQGDATAQSNLGEVYITGQAIQNYNEGYVWSMKAYNQGKKTAGCHLGILYAYGLGVKHSPEEALKHYHDANEDTYPLAQILLGLCYLIGIEEIISIDAEKAYILFKKAAIASEKYQNYTYNSLIGFFERLSDGGEISARLMLAIVHQEGLLRITQNEASTAKALQYYEKAIKFANNKQTAAIFDSLDKISNGFIRENLKNLKEAKETPQIVTAVPLIPVLTQTVTPIEKWIDKGKSAVQRPSIILPLQPTLTTAKPISRQQRALPIPPSSSEVHEPKPVALQAIHNIRIPAGTMQLKSKLQNVNVILSYGEIQMGKVLGKGGFGIVYKGIWNYNPVAVKKLHKRDLDKDAKLEFEHEAAVMLELRHPNILKLYGITLEPEYCMVMEFMEGGSLYAILQSTQILKWPLRYKIAMDTVKGLAYLHGRTQPILHRDLKSSNILLDGLHKAKLADFGLSRVKSLDDRSIAVGKAGTLAWIAPELLSNPDKAEFTAASDIYSLSVVFWELITRQVPYRAAYKGQREDLPQNAPEVFVELTKRCWAENPLDRPTAPEVYKFILENPIASHDERALSPRSKGKGRVILLPSSSSSQSMAADVNTAIAPPMSQSTPPQTSSGSVEVATSPTGPSFFSKQSNVTSQRIAQNKERSLPKPPSAISTNQSQQSNGASFGSFQFSGISAGDKRKSIGGFQFSGVYSQETQSTSIITDSTVEKAGLRAQVQHQFIAQQEEDLTVEKGAIVRILKQEGAWWQCEYNGKTGMVPGNYLKVISGPAEEKKDAHTKPSYGRI